MKAFLLFIIFITISPAKTLFIENNFTAIDTSEYQEVIEDKYKTMTRLDILENRYDTIYVKNRVGSTNSVFWNKIRIKNNTARSIHLVFQNNRAGTDCIDIYIYKNKHLINTHLLGDLRNQEDREYLSPKSVFKLELNADEEYMIISRFDSLGPMNLSWYVLNESVFYKKSNFEFLFNGIFVGILIALILYNFLMFISLKEVSFLLYVLITFCMLWIQYTYSGMFYFFNLGINLDFLSLSAWFVPYLYSSIFMLFTIMFFKIYNKNKYIYYAFLTLSGIGLLLSFVALSLFIDTRLAIYTPYTHIYLLLVLLSVFVYSMYATLKGYPFAIYFLIGESVYIASFVYAILVVSGVLNISNGFQFFVPSGMLVEMIFFSIALSKKIKLLKQKSDMQDIILIEESKFSAIGKGIGNVSHQWKTPLSQLNTHFLYLRALYHTKNEKKLLEEFGDNIKNIESIINYMKSSIEDLHHFYTSTDKNKHFKIKKQITLANTLQKNKLILNNIILEINCDENLSLIGEKHAFANILMILLDNSIYQFENNDISNSRINISAIEINNQVEIKFTDNAGGINMQHIEQIFEMNFSTKGNEGSGLGLTLAKKLVEDSLCGRISVKNTEDGSEFSIII